MKTRKSVVTRKILKELENIQIKQKDHFTGIMLTIGLMTSIIVLVIALY